MLWKDRVCDVLAGCTGQNVVFGDSDVQVGGLRDRGGERGRSTPVRDWDWVVLEWVRPVPVAGELQANVSLANADKNVADRVWLSRRTEG